MKQINKVIKHLIEDRINKIHTALPAKIKSYNAKTMYAEVILLNKKELEGEQVQIPPIVEVPVAHLNAGGFVIRPPYKKGDIVQVVFNERALDKLLITGKSEEVKLTRKFSYDDAVVIKGLKLESEQDLNSSYTEDLLMENMDGNSRIVMKANGDLLIETNGNTTVDTNGSTTVNSGSPVTVNALTTTVNGNVNLAGGGPPLARIGDAIETYVSGGSSAGTHSGIIVAGSGKSTSG
ncbi:MAG: hypothetical protein K9L62_15885 [Vallitaleaceae bacterium]|nr:hypothetical protein [Vallitaleaceae bacterium]